eukprot:g2265.t1
MLRDSMKKVFRVDGGNRLARLTELHHIFWAVITDRPQLAIVLWKTMKSPLAGGILAQFAYRELGKANPLRKVDFEVRGRQFAGLIQELLDTYSSHEKAIDMLQMTNPDFTEGPGASYSNGHASMPVWYLFGGCMIENPTVVDLALETECIEMLAHPHTYHFLDEVYAGGASRHNVLGLNVDLTPRGKYMLRVATFAIFLGLYLGVLGNFIHSSRHRSLSVTWLESSFWIFALSYLVDEIQQMRTFSTEQQGLTALNLQLRQYSRAPANLIDMVIHAIFIASFSCRWKYQEISVGLFCMNGIVLVFRFVEMLQLSSRSIGEMHIIVKRIITTNVNKWSVYSIIMALGFISSNCFFLFYQIRHSIIPENGAQQSIWTTSFLMLYAFTDPGQVVEANDESGFFVHSLHTFFILLYLVFSSLIMTNLLIAFMSSTYTEVLNNADAEYTARVRREVREYYFARPLGPPFNLVIPICSIVGSFSCCFSGIHGLLRRFCNYCCPSRAREEYTNSGDTRTLRIGNSRQSSRSVASLLMAANTTGDRLMRANVWFRDWSNFDRLKISFAHEQVHKLVVNTPRWTERAFSQIVRGSQQQRGRFSNERGGGENAGNGGLGGHVETNAVRAAGFMDEDQLAAQLSKLKCELHDEQAQKVQQLEETAQRHSNRTDELLMKMQLIVVWSSRWGGSSSSSSSSDSDSDIGRADRKRVINYSDSE